MRPNISQLMVPIEEFPVISEDEYIDRAAELIVASYGDKDSTWRGYESLHVVDNNKTSVGVLTLSNILMAVNKSGKPGRTVKSRYLAAMGADSPRTRVKDLMTNLNNNFVEIDDGVESAIKVIVGKNLSYVPVRSGRDLVGVIRAIDLFWFIEDLL